MNKILKRALSLILCLTLLVGAAVPAFAALKVVTDAEKEKWVTFFNDTVNPIKTELPRAKVKYNNFVPEGGITVGGESAADAIDSEMQRFLVPVLEGMFNTRSSTAKSFVRTLLGTEGNTVESLELHRTMLRDKTVPVYGRPYVSALTAADDFDIILDIADGKKTPAQLAISFQDQPLATARETSIGKAFYLPSGAINPMLISGERSKYAERLDGAQITDFNIRDAKIVTKYDKNGGLTYYGSTVKYRFCITFKDMMNLLSAVLGYDFYQSAINTVNTILVNLNREGITAESVLEERKIYITYCCTVEITDFNFDPRIFGDVDDDGRVTGKDARAALRHAIGLELIASTDDQIFADIDFDGNITTADARLILRTSIGLDPAFTEVPEGKKILIVQVEEEPEDPDEPDPQNPGDGEESLWFDDFDPILTLSDIVEDVFAYIGMVQGAEGEAQDYISQFIEAIKNAIGNDEENP